MVRVASGSQTPLQTSPLGGPHIALLDDRSRSSGWTRTWKILVAAAGRSSPGCLSSSSLYAKQTKNTKASLRRTQTRVYAPLAAVATEPPLPGLNLRHQGVHPAFLLEQKLRQKRPPSSSKPSKFPDFQIINRGIPPINYRRCRSPLCAILCWASVLTCAGHHDVPSTSPTALYILS